MANTTSDIEALAAEIGENIYIDVAKWHLYLSNANLHTTVAEKAYSLIDNNNLSEDALTALLQEIKVTLGGGRLELPLVDLLPTKCQVNLMDILEEFQKNH
ncbi:MAG: hypothetical protein N5P05_000151 [Chroococcopsis gigantea SAG 12.99]|jgi:hypothetical protein|nr:DUF3181 family protein [Chlorogloea purpurea SAG 13.99]MDV2998545.1 hypothetical protein [Chroococcopsis gigantea SAG 12.99]